MFSVHENAQQVQPGVPRNAVLLTRDMGTLQQPNRLVLQGTSLFLRLAVILDFARFSFDEYRPFLMAYGLRENLSQSKIAAYYDGEYLP